jgi:AbrB family looped-hinge helix DNA binding protein
MSVVHASSKGQVVLPRDVRKRYGITQGTRLEVIDSGRGTIVLVPVPADPLAALDGMLAGGESTAESITEARRLDAQRDAGRP